ncbi:MAG: hypothetical protein M1814_003971 [Vezdaea aestivalis]|nr:MAG: hypothetical protein M1814_003971 [Vezdaea aestivalis]
MAKISKQPSHYPVLPFYALRFFQGSSALIALIIVIYFVLSLTKDNFGIPWSLLILLLASFLTLLSLVTTNVLHCCRTLKVAFNLTLNIVLFIIWVVAFGIFAWATNGTINAACTTEYWGNDTGVGVCRLYKAVFSLAIICGISTLLCIVLDIVVQRRQHSLGAYEPTPDVKLGEFTGYDGERRNSGGPFDVPSEYNNTGAHQRQQGAEPLRTAPHEEGFGNDPYASQDRYNDHSYSQYPSHDRDPFSRREHEAGEYVHPQGQQSTGVTRAPTIDSSDVGSYSAYRPRPPQERRQSNQERFNAGNGSDHHLR